MSQGLAELDALVREEKRLCAAETQTEAWAEGLSSGIEPELIAEAALATAFQEMVRIFGEEPAVALIDRMRERIIGGEFTPNLIHH